MEFRPGRPLSALIDVSLKDNPRYTFHADLAHPLGEQEATERLAEVNDAAPRNVPRAAHV